MKIVIIGDIHGRSSWKLIVSVENPDMVIFLGDYFDSHHFTTEEQCNNFLDIIAFKKANSNVKVITLIGNHDYHYLPGIDDTATSGFQTIGQYVIRPIIEQNKEHLQMCFIWDKFLFTHAGVGETWLKKHGWEENEPIDIFINDLFKYKPYAFFFSGNNPYGDDMGQTPIWIRPRSLMKDGKLFKKKYIQVVGHTSQNQVDVKGKATGGRYWFMDTLGTSGEYMVIEKDEIKINKI